MRICPSPITARIACCALLIVALLVGSMDAMAASPSRQALETSINRVLELIKNPSYTNPVTRAPIRQQIEDEIFHIFDFSEFASRTVGQRWKTFSSEQQKAFAAAFADLLLTTYLGKIDGYGGEQVAYTGELANAKGTRVEQKTEIILGDGKKVPVNYRMLPKDGQWVVYDVLVEGISLVKNYQTQFQDILRTASPDELITRVKTKALEARSAHEAR